MTTVKLITLTEPRSAAAEGYRTLRTNLIFSGVERSLATLVITSPSSVENKSQVLANLAVTFAQAGNKTIIVDADLRTPTQHTIWGVSNARGLTTMMLEPEALAMPPLVDTGVENLSLLPSGTLPPVPADLFSSQRMSEVLGVLKARANYVLFEAPPVLTATDAALLAARLDGTLLVVKTGGTRRDHLARAREELKRVNARVLGAVLTDAARDSVS
ncbi:MAG: CpsD/CapB family tyrosine-protein kinase [Pleurocapsa minor GSE-CHR-MK-17-07R]|jgi:non-specific protein-tyrosine kinase|nr:CpsD/CapB family tyrosine-protein kinase [Pleurocapsa minor GSE-CHR-MK 17-07R]